jgi:hypothetical protein
MTRLDSPLYGRMIFVVGARRSGTNWLQRIISAHPEVLAVPSETHLFSHGLAQLAERFQHALPTSPSTGLVYMERDALLDSLRDFCDSVFGRLAELLGGNGARICERTPLHAQHLGLISDVYPDAAVIHIIRDGRDSARSLLAQPWGPDTMTEAAREWATTVSAARAAKAPWYREVRYEELFADPVTGSAELFSWLDLPVDAAVAERVALEAAAPFNVDASRPEVTLNKWVSDLTPAEQAAFEAEAGELNRSLGYGLDDPPTPAPERRSLSVRASLARARARTLGRRPGGDAVAEPLRDPDPEVLAATVSEFVGAATGGGTDTLVGFVTDETIITVVDRNGRRSDRGPAGLLLLMDVLPPRGSATKQVRGDVHYGSPTTATVVLGHQDGTGNISETMFLVSLAVTSQGPRLTQVVYYCFPLSAAPALEAPSVG